MPTIQFGKQPIYYAESGGGKEERFRPVVLVHGAGESHLHWPQTLRRIDGARVFTLDLPGHGRSPEGEPGTVESFAALLVAFCDSLDIEAPVLIGHSMGGLILIEAVSQGLEVSGLIFLCSGARMGVSLRILNELINNFDQITDWLVQLSYLEGAQGSLLQLGVERLRQVPPDVLLADFSACADYDGRPHLPRVEAPALVVGAEGDRMTPIRLSRELAEGLPHARLEVVAESGHMVQLEQPEIVSRLVNEFVGTHG